MRSRPVALRALLLVAAFAVAAQTVLAGAPAVVWSAPDPVPLDSHVGAVAWAPGGAIVADGMGHRWVRLRRASDGGVITSILQPPHSGGVVRLRFSRDGQALAVGNASGTLSFNVYDVASVALLGHLVAAVDASGVVHYAADAQLSAAGAVGLLSDWALDELPVFVTTGSGYLKVTTRFAVSPNTALQTASSKGTIKVQRTSDGTLVATLSGGASTFSPDASRLAVWFSDASKNTVAAYRTSDWSLERTFRSPGLLDGGIALRYTASADRIVETGYLPYETSEGWQQRGIIRSWTVATGALKTYGQLTGIGVTSGVAFSPDGGRMLFGTYEGITTTAAFP